MDNEIFVQLEHAKRVREEINAKAKAYSLNHIYTGKVYVWGFMQNDTGTYEHIPEAEGSTPFFSVKVSPAVIKDSDTLDGLPDLATMNFFEGDDPMLFNSLKSLIGDILPENVIVMNRTQNVGMCTNLKKLPKEVEICAVTTKAWYRFYDPKTKKYRTKKDPVTKKEIDITFNNLGNRAIIKGKSWDTTVGRELAGRHAHMIKQEIEAEELEQ